MESSIYMGKEHQVILSTAYLPPVEWYAFFLSSEARIEAHCSYIKQTYRNRAVILSANGIMDLSIPIEKSEMRKPLTKDIRISDHGNWRHLHWNAIVSAYNSSPFFEYYRDDFQPFYERKFNYLFDFNQELLQLTLELLDIEKEIVFSDQYRKEEEMPGVEDLRDIIHPKNRLEPLSGFKAKPYYQVFEERLGFQPNLSIIDLLFNMGNESVLVIK